MGPVLGRVRLLVRVSALCFFQCFDADDRVKRKTCGLLSPKILYESLIMPMRAFGQICFIVYDWRHTCFPFHLQCDTYHFILPQPWTFFAYVTLVEFPIDIDKCLRNCPTFYTGMAEPLNGNVHKIKRVSFYYSNPHSLLSIELVS